MRPQPGSLLSIVLFVVTLAAWTWVSNHAFLPAQNLSVIGGCVALVFPVAWIGRRALDRQPTADRASRVTRLVHFAVMTLFGAAIVRAVISRRDWVGWTLPIPQSVGWYLVLVTGAAALLTVANLAWKGLGAPFAIALSQKLSVDWMYAWTRNPMVLATLSWLVAMGIWFQSALFVVWVLLLVSPALLAFVKHYEERELEIRFGAAYRAYRSRTPMLFPRRPRGPAS
jgi:protein-S-isoprenylcysteine O-methyltransferase Ste14